jgi:hypothetical protein
VLQQSGISEPTLIPQVVAVVASHELFKALGFNPLATVLTLVSAVALSINLRQSSGFISGNINGFLGLSFAAIITSFIGWAMARPLNWNLPY